MGMAIDTNRAQKCLYGITLGMTTKELMDYTGYGDRTVREIKKNPEKYQKLLEEQEEKKEEYRPPYAELFAIEWERVTSRIKKDAGWEDKKNAAHN